MIRTRRNIPAAATLTLGGADQEDDVAADFEMPVRQTAVADVVLDPCRHRAAAERLDGRVRQGAEAHARDVEDRRRIIGLAAQRPISIGPTSA